MTQIDNKIIHTSVFSNGPNGGNPCPVILNADNLTAEQGMALAEKFGAETILVVKSNNIKADLGLRYFVPKHEMEMCVHGTIAAITVLWGIGDIAQSPLKISTNLGNIDVAFEELSGELQVTVFQFPAKFASSSPSTTEVCSALRIPESSILTDTGPIVSTSTSRYKLIIPLTNQRILDQLTPDFRKIWDLCDQYKTTGFYPFSKADASEPDTFAARQFPRRAGYNEDPATGVAACALGAYLATYWSHKEGWQHFNILQGYAMKHPSRLSVGAYCQDGSVTQTRVSGKAILKDKPFPML